MSFPRATSHTNNQVPLLLFLLHHHYMGIITVELSALDSYPYIAEKFPT